MTRLLWALWSACHKGTGAETAGIHCRFCGHEITHHARLCPVRLIFINPIVGPCMNRAYKRKEPQHGAV